MNTYTVWLAFRAYTWVARKVLVKGAVTAAVYDLDKPDVPSPIPHSTIDATVDAWRVRDRLYVREYTVAADNRREAIRAAVRLAEKARVVFDSPNRRHWA